MFKRLFMMKLKSFFLMRCLLWISSWRFLVVFTSMGLRFVTNRWILMAGECTWDQGKIVMEFGDILCFLFLVFLTTLVSLTAWYHSKVIILPWRQPVRYLCWRKLSSVILTLPCPPLSGRQNYTTITSSSASVPSVCTAIGARGRGQTCPQEIQGCHRGQRRRARRRGRGRGGGDDSWPSVILAALSLE